MKSFMERSAKHFLVIKAARQFSQELEKAGLDKLKTLADAGISVVATYLNGCSPQEKATYRRDLAVLLQMGVSPDMILEEVTRQNPRLALIMQGRENYKRSEIQKLNQFLVEG